MALAVRNPGKIVGFTSQSILGDGFLVAMGSADLTVALPSGATPTTPLVGLVYAPGLTPSGTIASGTVVDVVLDGIYVGRAAGTITRGDLVTSGGTDGTVITATASAGVNAGIIGEALASAVTGDYVSILIRPFIKQF